MLPLVSPLIAPRRDSVFSESVSVARAPSSKFTVDRQRNCICVFGTNKLISFSCPIFPRVYSVGMYGDEETKEELSSISKSDDKTAIAALRKGASGSSSFVIKMNFKVGAEKMAAAIADSVSPRHSSASEVSELKDLIFAGVSDKGAAVKGTVIEFDCSDGVEVTVDGKTSGKVESEGLAKALCDVYLDDKCVSPKLRESIIDNCCAE